eukprot:4739311-Lingulodinium_polyedra.AAC.1
MAAKTWELVQASTRVRKAAQRARRAARGAMAAMAWAAWKTMMAPPPGRHARAKEQGLRWKTARSWKLGTGRLAANLRAKAQAVMVKRLAAQDRQRWADELAGQAQEAVERNDWSELYRIVRGLRIGGRPKGHTTM